MALWFHTIQYQTFGYCMLCINTPFKPSLRWGYTSYGWEGGRLLNLPALPNPADSRNRKLWRLQTLMIEDDCQKVSCGSATAVWRLPLIQWKLCFLAKTYVLRTRTVTIEFQALKLTCTHISMDFGQPSFFHHLCVMGLSHLVAPAGVPTLRYLSRVGWSKKVHQ